MLVLVVSKISAQVPRGLDLCMAAEKVLSGAKVRIERHDIVNTSNNLPYNIIVKIAEDGEASKGAQTAVIAFCMEDVYEKANEVKQCLNALVELGKPCTLLFSYGDIAPYEGAKTMSGTVSFVLEAADEDMAAVCVSWGTGNKVQVSNGGGGGTTPALMLKSICASLNEQNIPYTVGAGSFGALYRFGVLRSDERVAAFIRAAAAACGVRFGSEVSGENIAKCLSSFVVQANEGTLLEGGVHYITFHTPSRFFIFGEEHILIVFIAASFFAILFICLPHTKKEIKAIRHDLLRLLYLLPATLIITASSLAAGQYAVISVLKRTNIAFIWQFYIKTSVAFVSITVVYCLLVCFLRPLDSRTKDTQANSEDTYCYLLSVVSLLNMLLFSAIDISTVFLFGAEYAIVLVARRARTIPSITASCALMALPYAPYIFVLSRYAQSATFTQIIYASPAANTLYAMILVPHLMQWMRILSRIFAVEVPSTPAQIAAARAHTLKACVTTAFFAIGFGIAMFVTLNTAHSLRNVSGNKSIIKMTEINDSLLECSAHDDKFFDDTLRTITINTGRECLEVAVQIKGEVSPTVLYCDDFYIENEEERTDTFRLPPFPPQKIVYAFSADASQTSTITITAVYDAKNNSEEKAKDNSEEERIYEVRTAVITKEADI